MTAGAVREQPLRLAWPHWQPPSGGGVVALVTRADATLGWADALLARDDTGWYVWTSRGADPERRALEILELPDVRAATLTPDGADPRQVGLALEVGVRLAAARAARDAPPTAPGAAGPAVVTIGGASRRGCLTSWSQPTPPPGTVRVPHLVTVRHAALLTDAVVWELTSPAAVQRWLGIPLPDQQLVEAHLDGLVRLRAAARSGALPATAAAARLASLLGSRELSIELVYRRPELFQLLLGASGRGRR